jgi:hypothetical protein
MLNGARLQAHPLDPAQLASSCHIGGLRYDRARRFPHMIATMRTRQCSSPGGSPTIRDGRSLKAHALHAAPARIALPVPVNALPLANRSDMPPPLWRYMNDPKVLNPVYPSSRN